MSGLIVKRLPVLVCGLAMLAMAACTTTKIEAVAAQRAAEPHASVVVGDVEAANSIWRHHLPFIREGMMREFVESGEFTKVIDGTDDPLPESVAIVSGTLTEVNEGSTAARFIIGFGAGSSKVGGTFRIAAADGTVLAEFTEREVYAGGAGIGGVDMLSMSQLMGRMGEEVAKAVVRWNRGEPLKPETE